MKILLITGIVIAISATDIWVQGIGIFLAYVALFVIDTRVWK